MYLTALKRLIFPWAARPPVLVVDEPNDGTNWRHFVAILCFIEFYRLFVSNGYEIGLRWFPLRPDVTPGHIDIEFWLCVLGMLRGAALFGCGRSLWLAHRTRLWAASAIGLSLAVIGLQYAEVLLRRGFKIAWLFWGPASGTLFSRSFWWLWEYHVYLAWLAILLLCIRASHQTGRALSRASQHWPMMAVAWSVLALPPSFIIQSVWFICGAASPATASPRLMLACYLSLVLLTVVCLLTKRRAARTFALCLAAAEILAGLYPLYHVAVVSHAGITSLYYSAYANLGPPPPFVYFVFTRDCFGWLFLDIPTYAGPWLLIAIYAWRKPLVAMPEDGSPYPRRYCAKCRYNLHGLESDRCPECGTSFASA